MYSEYLKTGRSRGDDLLGFLIDLEYFLEDLEGSSDVSVRSTDDEDNLLVATLKFDSEINEGEFARSLEETWMNNLRYKQFEKHSAIVSERKVEFYFCTISSPIGVTGKIVANGT